MNYKNRGKSFETLIKYSNITYARKKWGFIEKSEPPVKVRSQKGPYITGWFESKGFVDYFGISNGRPIAFEAKSTKERKRFPLDNVHEHQVNDLKVWNEQGGIAFLLVEFRKHREVYYLSYDDFEKWWDDQFKGGRKSIPYDWFVMNCPLVKPGRGVILDYLAIVDLP
ncbi:Holliday junction resolvase RecU [Halobacillus sp. H74]|uniref:Holliday junction resolvase RecU n=1 Tax=Halobacillus sp. H74 TaxID=3457436 RepID=UPI003FCE2D21